MPTGQYRAPKTARGTFFGVLAVLALSGCATSSLVADYSGRLTDAFMRETDPELARLALPTVIKIAEALLAGSPDDPDIALTTGSLYVMYANAFVQEPASMLDVDDWELQAAEYARAAALYDRAVGVLLPVFLGRFPGYFRAGSVSDAPPPVPASMKKADVPLVYWLCAAIFSRYPLDPINSAYSESAGLALPLAKRAADLDPGWNGASLPSMLMALYAGLPESSGGGIAAAKAEYARALELAGPSPGLLVGYAQSICVPEGDYPAFREALETALSIPVPPESALLAAISRRKAAWLLEHASDYFRIEGESK